MPANRQTIQRDFASLARRLERLKARYHSTSTDLEMILFGRGDAELYPELLSLAADGLKTVRKHHAYFAKYSLYGRRHVLVRAVTDDQRGGASSPGRQG